MRTTTDRPDRARCSAPAKAGSEAWRRFCDPARSHYRSPDHRALIDRARAQLAKAERRMIETPAGRVPLYTFEPAADRAAGPPTGTILLVHGWTSEAAVMTAFVEPLRQRRRRVIAVDLPGHGFAGARRASLVACATGLGAVLEVTGPVDGVVAHSMGALVAALVAEGRPPLRKCHCLGRMALIAAPNRLKTVTDDHACRLGLTPAATRWFERQVERAGRRSLATFSAAGMLAPLAPQLLVVHSRDDVTVGFHNSEEIAAAVSGARLAAVDGLGHARVLYAPPVVKLVRDFLCRD